MMSGHGGPDLGGEDLEVKVTVGDKGSLVVVVDILVAVVVDILLVVVDILVVVVVDILAVEVLIRIITLMKSSAYPLVDFILDTIYMNKYIQLKVKKIRKRTILGDLPGGGWLGS
jgi:hypothetical protein